ncbi:murein biosynthesis integral membrane protein MurJ [bacterium]|nr:murein biosynthesis integral membrane protein MurJ [bacterium]
MTDSALIGGADQVPSPAPPPVPTDRAAILVAAGILLSRVSGIIREAVLSRWLGASNIAADAFAISLQIPKMLQNLLGEGALSASFIPVYSSVVDRDPRAARRLAGAVFGLLAALVGTIVLVLMFAARPIVGLIVRGAGDTRADLIAELVRTMAPGIGFIVFAAWCLGILNAHRDFFLSYVAPMLWNIAIITAILIWTTQTNDSIELARAGAWGVFLGGVAQFAVQLPRVLRIAGPITPSLDRTGGELREVVRRFIPGVAGRGVVTLGTFTDIALASFLAVGAVAVLTKAQILYMMPISVFAVSIAAADLPELSRETADASAATERVRTAIDRVSLFVVFSAIAFVFGGRSLVGALFEGGQFTSDDTVAVWLTLAVFSVGLLASALSRVFQTASFAQGDVAGPAKIALARLVVAAVVGFCLMFPADRYQVVDGLVRQSDDLAFGPLGESIREQSNSHRLGAVGLAAGGAIAAWLEFALLGRRLRRTTTALGIWAALRRLIPASFAAGIAVAGLAAALNGLPPLLAAPLVIGPPGLLYMVVAKRCGNMTADALIRRAVGLVRS